MIAVSSDGKVGTDIAHRMAHAIKSFRLGNDRLEFPKYIYLGREETAEFELMVREKGQSVAWGDLEIGPGKAYAHGRTIFMGVEVITVDKPSHLVVGE